MLCMEEIGLCVCKPGFTFSHPFARCEPSKRPFRDFRIRGPSRVNSTVQSAHFSVVFTKAEDMLKEDWQYGWLVQDGHEFANYSGTNTSRLILYDMKPGFILFGVSVSNDDVYGFVPHNLTIIDESDLPSNASLAVVKNVTITLPAIQTILQATELKRPAVHYQWTPYPEIPMEMVVGQSLVGPRMLLINLSPGRHLFNLTVSIPKLLMEHTTTAELLVLGEEVELNSVEIVCERNPFGALKTLSHEVEQIMREAIGSAVKLNFTKAQPNLERSFLRLVFQLFNRDGQGIVDAETVVTVLRQNATFQRAFGVHQIRTFYCSASSCSGHGVCGNQSWTRSCVCYPFWMPNPLLAHGDWKQDCSFPIIAIWLTSLLALLLMAKAAHLIWAWHEEQFAQKSKRMQKLLFDHSDRKQSAATTNIAGRFSPVGNFRQRRGVKIRHQQPNSIRAILKRFDRSSAAGGRIEATALNEDSDGYDEEEEEEDDDD